MDNAQFGMGFRTLSVNIVQNVASKRYLTGFFAVCYANPSRNLGYGFEAQGVEDMSNLLIVHGGAPTAVMNASLYGVIEEARNSQKIDRVFGAIGGSEAVLAERFLDLLAYPESETRRLLRTPASSIGTSRFALEEHHYTRMAEILKKHDIRYVLMNGGNGTMDTCGRLDRVCRGLGISVIGVPKTIDNDIAVTDHAPGYASAARFVAASVSEIACDVEALPIHVSIMETMGRNAGWITAAAALARREAGDAPHLIYLPERGFRTDWFLEDVERLYRRHGGVVVVCSEGLTGENGELLVPPVYTSGRSVYPSYVGMHLANLVIQELGIKARYEKAGLCERTSIPWQSRVDREEAVAVGRAAVRAALEGKSGLMIGIERISSDPYEIRLTEIPVDRVMMVERKIPDHWINARGNDVTEEFLNWCRPLVGDDFGEYLQFTKLFAKRNEKE